MKKNEQKSTEENPSEYEWRSSAMEDLEVVQDFKMVLKLSDPLASVVPSSDQAATSFVERLVRESRSQEH